MLQRKGFTLIEIIVVLVIIGVCIAIYFPNYYSSIQKSDNQNAQNNLIAINTAELNYFNNNGTYCTATVPVNCADSTTDINTNLSLNITDSNFNYACTKNGSTFTCKATGVANGTTITLTGGKPLVVTGATTNPSCSGSYC